MISIIQVLLSKLTKGTSTQAEVGVAPAGGNAGVLSEHPQAHS